MLHLSVPLVLQAFELHGLDLGFIVLFIGILDKFLQDIIEQLEPAKY